MAAKAPPAVTLRRREGLGTWGRLRRATPWWAQPLTVAGVLVAFSGYSIWTAFFGPGANHVSEAGPYLSPFFSPLWWKTGPVTPAIWVLWSPLAFRGTCYYYRKAYFRSFAWDPPACAVGERRRGYRGETRLPWVLNNLHRFFWYPAVIVVVFLWIEAFESFDYHGHLYLGLGTFFLLLNAILLSAYTFGCHAFRHLVGGGLDCYSCVRAGRSRFRLWRGVSVLNANHPAWAWVSMLSVVWAEVYVRLLQAGMPDPHIRF